MDGKSASMGILDIYINPPDETIRVKDKERLIKEKSKLQRKLCSHANLRYEKWVHNGPIQGKTLHFKEICKDCGSRKNVPRTKEIFDIVKDQPWHHKKSKSLTPKQ